MAMTCRLYRHGQLESAEFEPAQASELLKDPALLLWLDIEGPTEENMAMLGREYGFHELALEDCLHPHQRPKIEQYGSYYFLVAYAVSIALPVAQLVVAPVAQVHWLEGDVAITGTQRGSGGFGSGVTGSIRAGTVPDNG